MSTKDFGAMSLVELLIQLEEWELAAQVVLEAEKKLAIYAQLIDKESANAENLPVGVTLLVLKRIVETALLEIQENYLWQRKVSASFPKDGGAGVKTTPLREAFNKIEHTRTNLLQQIIVTQNRHLKITV
jgi:hypothetical protein